MKSTEHLEALYRSRGEVFLGEVTHDHVASVIDQLAELKVQGKPLKLVINSPGGVTTAGFTLAQFIEQELESDVTARVWGGCSSAATYALLCCKRRIAHPQAVFVIHRQTTSLEVEYTDQFNVKTAEWARSQAFIHKLQVDFYSRKIGRSPKKVVKLLDRGMGFDSELSATEAKKIGLITEIISLP